MAKLNLRGVHRVRSKGRVYFYAWKGRGAPRLYSPPGTPEFVEELAEALARRKVGNRTRLDGLVADYRASDEFRRLSDSTKRQWRPWLDRIQAHFGPLRLRQFDRPQIRIDIKRWRDGWKNTPRTADFAVQVLSRVLAYGVAEGRVAANHCLGLPRLYTVDRADRVWTNSDLAELEKHASVEIMQAAQLALLTGLRRGDLLRLSWSHVHADFIELRTSKSRGRAIAIIPLYKELRDYMATIPRRTTTVLTNTAGKPWGTGFGASWNRAVKAAGLDRRDLHFHDLRGSAATRMYAAGLSEVEIAQTLGWEEARVGRMIDRYVRKDDIMRERARRLAKNTSRTKKAKPAAKPTRRAG